jgi:hypothetical protein
MRKLTLEIKQDEDPMNPRECDNLGKMVCFHGRYELGDKHSMSMEDAKALHAKMNKEGVALPLYLYDHSGITMSTAPFSCPWDSGQVGFIYADKEAIRKNFMKKACSKKMLAQALEILRDEVKVYDQYLTGDVYGYVIKDEEGEVVDSCWGFFGMKDAEEQGKAALESENKREAQEVKKVEACMAL